MKKNLWINTLKSSLILTIAHIFESCVLNHEFNKYEIKISFMISFITQYILNFV